MNGSVSSSPLTGAVRAEAAAWVARLHGSSRSAALEAGLRKWIEADARHARAFELATEAWEIAGGIRPTTGRTSVPRSFRRMAIAATVLLAFVGALAWMGRGASPIATQVGEQRILTLDDGTRVSLNTDTRIVVEQDSTRRRVRLVNGEALFDVAKDPRRPFIVTAGDQDVIALGTSFVVRRESQKVTVTLMEGRVTVTPVELTESRHPETFLEPGQRVTFAAHEPPSLDEPSIEQVTAWRRGEVILDSTRLSDAAEEMNRYSDIKLVVEDPAVAGIPVSGIFRAGDSLQFARALGETYQLDVQETARRIVLSSK
jgi:transmembrane sensor